MIGAVNGAVKAAYYTEKKPRSQQFSQMDSIPTAEIENDKNSGHTDIQDIYMSQVSGKNRNIKRQASEVQEDEETKSERKPHKTTYYQGVPLETWALTDPKYTDSETGISWYIRDGKYPYMLGEDAEKFEKMCAENGEFALKKFAEMTGLIQQIDKNTVAYIGDNGICIKSKDGKELSIDTSAMSYESLMNMFKNLPSTDDYFNSSYWAKNISAYRD